MMAAYRLLTQMLEFGTSLPVAVGRFLSERIAFNPRLGPLRYLFLAGIAYVLFALVLVYVVAPLRGITGAYYLSDKLRYDAERWLATAIYDSKGGFAGRSTPASIAAVTSTTQMRPSNLATTLQAPITSPYPFARCRNTTGSA